MSNKRFTVIVLILALTILAIPAERPTAKGFFLPWEQTCIPMLDAYWTIARWPNYGGHRRK